MYHFNLLKAAFRFVHPFLQYQMNFCQLEFFWRVGETPTTVRKVTTDIVSQDRDESRTFATIRGRNVANSKKTLKSRDAYFKTNEESQYLWQYFKNNEGSQYLWQRRMMTWIQITQIRPDRHGLTRVVRWLRPGVDTLEIGVRFPPCTLIL